MTPREDGAPLRVAVLGATGSIGTQTLSVCRHHPGRLRVVALSARDRVRELVRYAREFDVHAVALANGSHSGEPALSELPGGCACGFGDRSVAALAARDDVDCVVNAVVGAAGVGVGHAALVAGKRLLSANKESIVVGGELLMPLAGPGQLIPVDSEHSAIFQCLVGERHEDVRRLWLTCSGGPFLGRTRKELEHVSPAEALAHPTWSMGEKISIDSATLMNKGLELLEAARLFDVPVDDVRVLVQRQSRIHSMVEFVDGSTKAQLGASDMRIPIQYALSYPERWEGPCEQLDYTREPPLTFGEADEATFGCLALAREAGRVGGTLPCAMNAANEVANEAFRKGLCGFLDIERIVAAVMDETPVERVETTRQLVDVDARARRRASALVVEVG